MIKRKTKKRITLFVVLLVALSAILGSFSAFALPNAQEYDFSVLTNANLIETPRTLNVSYNQYTASIESNQMLGEMTFTALKNLTGSNGQIVALTIGQYAPYLKIGDEVVFSWETDFESAYSNNFQFLNGSTFGDFYTNGTPITITQSILNSYMVFYPFAGSATQGTVHTYSEFRCNLNESKPFEPYEKTQEYVSYLNNIYTNGKNEGIIEGANSQRQYAPIFNADDLEEVAITYRNISTNLSTMEIYNFYSDRPNPWSALIDSGALNGFVVNSQLFPKEVTEVIEGYDIVTDFIVGFNLQHLGQGEVEPILLNACEVSFAIEPLAQARVTVTIAGVPYTINYTNNSYNNVVYTFTPEMFALPLNSVVDYISVEYCRYEYVEAYTSNIYWREGFPQFVATTRSNEFADGYNNGFIVGNNEGYKGGYTDGLNLGTEQGYNTGYKEGQVFGEKRGYNQGKEDGYYQGKADANADEGTFYNLLYSVVQAPVTVLFGNGENTGMLNFEVLGVNMSYFYLSVLTLGLVLWAIRKVNFLT